MCRLFWEDKEAEEVERSYEKKLLICMMRTMRLIIRIFITLIPLLTIALFLYYLFNFTDTLVKQVSSPDPSTQAIERKLAKDNKYWKNLHFDLVDPAEAPLAIREVVEAGFRFMLHTHELLPNFAKSSLDCANCHFSGGVTTGGVNGGISLAGVAAEYPKFSTREQAVEDLAGRINNCFKFSLNGEPLPLGSAEMMAFITYLHWISQHYPIYGKAPWLGVKPLKSNHKGDKINGEKLFNIYCADCHGAKGEGKNDFPDHPGVSIPPLWGENSFNQDAGMNIPETFASFIYHNMPYEDPRLHVDEAIDIASFITSQPHPKRK